MTWCCANDKHARWRWQPFSSNCMIFLPPLTTSSFSQVLFSKSQADVSSIIPLCIAGSHCFEFQQHWKLPSNLHVLCIMQKIKKIQKNFFCPKWRSLKGIHFQTVEEESLLYYMSAASQDREHQSFNYENIPERQSHAAALSDKILWLKRQKAMPKKTRLWKDKTTEPRKS